jgi:hypothetical protein
MIPDGMDVVLSRIKDIEGRLGLLPNAGAQPTPAGGTAAGSRSYGAASPFDLTLGRIEDATGMGRAGAFNPQIEDLIAKYSARNGLDPGLVRAVIKQESGGNPQSVSVAGAQGLMQLMPETAAGYGVQNPLDPEQNVAAGTRHLAGMLREFNGDLPMALAAYNAGSAAVKRYGGVPPYSETQRYVQNIMGMLGRR